MSSKRKEKMRDLDTGENIISIDGRFPTKRRTNSESEAAGDRKKSFTDKSVLYEDSNEMDAISGSFPTDPKEPLGKNRYYYLFFIV